MRRGFAITLVYLGLLLVPFLLAALIVPSIVAEATKLADNAPQYAQDVTNFVEKSDRLQKLNKDYDITSKLEEQAGKIPEKLGDAAGTVRDLGIGIVNSLFATLTILILTAFMLGSGRRWVDAGLGQLPLDRRAATAAGARPLQQGRGLLRGRGDLPGRARRASSRSWS